MRGGGGGGRGETALLTLSVVSSSPTVVGAGWAHTPTELPHTNKERKKAKKEVK